VVTVDMREGGAGLPYHVDYNNRAPFRPVGVRPRRTLTRAVRREPATSPTVTFRRHPGRPSLKSGLSQPTGTGT
jgi:hypothetical protein